MITKNQTITKKSKTKHRFLKNCTLIVEPYEDYENTQEKILEFMCEHSLKNGIVNGKIIEYFELYRRDIFELFKTNLHHAHRIMK